MLRAVIFDFDGTIIDTEVPEFQSWSEYYASHGHVLELEAWCAGVGTRNGFDPYGVLEALLSSALDRAVVRQAVRTRNAELLEVVLLREGIEDWLAAAAELDLGVAIASSADLDWVSSHLERQGIIESFHAIVCAGEHLPPKPDPAVYQGGLEWLGVAPHEAVAIEDSPHGVAAAKAAGLYCIAVPNLITGKLDFSAADRVYSSLAEVSLHELAHNWDEIVRLT